MSCHAKANAFARFLRNRARDHVLPVSLLDVQVPLSKSVAD